MNTIRLRVAGALAAVFIIAGCAANAPRARPDAPAAARARDPLCLTDTGSRLPVSGTQCREIGRSYTNDDLMRTGSTTVGEALQLLDPSITVHR